MAKLREMIGAVAEALGMDETEVYGYARYLRESGLIASGGRGPGGAEMSANDAVNLLIAVSASPLAKHGPRAVRQLRDAVCAVAETNDAPDFAPRQGERLVVVLKRFLDQVLVGGFATWWGGLEHALRIEFHPRDPGVEIHLRRGETECAWFFLWPIPEDRLPMGDRREMVSFGYRTLLKVAETRQQ